MYTFLDVVAAIGITVPERNGFTTSTESGDDLVS